MRADAADENAVTPPAMSRAAAKMSQAARDDDYQRCHAAARDLRCACACRARSC